MPQGNFKTTVRPQNHSVAGSDVPKDFKRFKGKIRAEGIK